MNLGVFVTKASLRKQYSDYGSNFVVGGLAVAVSVFGLVACGSSGPSDVGGVGAVGSLTGGASGVAVGGRSGVGGAGAGGAVTSGGTAGSAVGGKSSGNGGGATGGTKAQGGESGGGRSGTGGTLVCPTPPTGNNYTIDSSGVTFTVGSGRLRLQVWKDDIIRVEYTNASSLPTKQSLSVNNAWGTPTFCVAEAAGAVTITTGRIKAKVETSLV